ncbi:signal recognition particle protein [Streptococcus pneumoniae]|nr:signal recognition particle protein [Streptococcus pneumoniae]
MSGDMNKMMKQMGINPNNLPKNMPNMGGMDMSALEGMMGQGGMPNLSALGGAGMPRSEERFSRNAEIGRAVQQECRDRKSGSAGMPRSEERFSRNARYEPDVWWRFESLD